MDSILQQGEPEAAALIHAAIEDFSHELALIIQRFLKLKEWKNTERIVIGGGFRASRIGELVSGRTTLILKSQKIEVELVPIRNHPDEAGLLGALHLAPVWMFRSRRYDCTMRGYTCFNKAKEGEAPWTYTASPIAIP